MASKEVLEQLQELEFTRDLEAGHIEKLAAIAYEVTFVAGQTLFREKDVGEFVYLIAEGKVALDIYVPGRGRTSVLTVGPGELLGWSSLFPSAQKTASARAVTDTQAIALNAAQLRDVMQADHDLGCALLWRVTEVIAGRLKATRLQLLDIFAPAEAA